MRAAFYEKIIFLIRKNLLVLEILFQRDAAGHFSGELGIVHHVAARVLCEVFFHDLFRNPADVSGQAGQSCSVHDCFHKLVVRHSYIKKIFFQLPSLVGNSIHISNSSFFFFWP